MQNKLIFGQMCPTTEISVEAKGNATNDAMIIGFVKKLTESSNS